VSVLLCPTCGHLTPIEQCSGQEALSELFPGSKLVRLHADCPRCGRYGCSFTEGDWDVEPPGLGGPGDDEPFGLCSLCGEPVKSSHTRPFGPLAWTGWCGACRAVSTVARKRPPRVQPRTYTKPAMMPMSPSWVDEDD
jgi:hypothetical protein